MTQIVKEKLECFICKVTSFHDEIISSSSFGFPDLDLRPPEMERSALKYTIQKCPECGYCSNDISEQTIVNKKLLESPEYLKILNDKNIPEVASSFIASSFLQERIEEIENAVWDSIKAAWICDDFENIECSIKWRKNALRLIELVKEKSLPLIKEKGTLELLEIDLMRRAEMFEEALNIVQNIKQEKLADKLIKLIDFQEELIKKKDINPYSISNVLKDIQG